MRRLSITLFALLGCKEQNPDFCPANPDDPRCSSTTDGGTTDAAEADTSMTATPICLGKDNFTVCVMPPTAPVSFADNAAIDTTTDPACLPSQPTGWEAAGQPASCFIVGTTLTIPNLSVTGTRPLVLVATDNITIDGVLDAASRTTPTVRTGPAAPSSACPLTSEASGYDGVTKEAGGGAAGGSFFHDPGENGGRGDAGMALGGVAAPSLTAAPVALRAGCNGQRGGNGSGGLASAGPGGRGGGAVYLLAGGTLAFSSTGAINASGSAGGGGSARGGGGGGGSGGMIVLHANAINAISGAKLMANGGGGAPGANPSPADDGKDPALADPLAGAPLTTGCNNGCGFGGGGASRTTPAQAGANSGDQHGGGGGGGGLGYIRSNKAIANIVSSPTPDLVP